MIYSTNLLIPSTILSAPRFVIFVAGPVIINAVADPKLIPLASHCCSKGIVPPPQTYIGTPIEAAINIPNALLFPKNRAITSSGTYLWNIAESKTPTKKYGPVIMTLRQTFFSKRKNKFGSVSRFSGSEKPLKLKNALSFLF